jgi:hypothetical protein
MHRPRTSALCAAIAGEAKSFVGQVQGSGCAATGSLVAICAKNVVAMPKGLVATLAWVRAGATFTVAIRNDRSPRFATFNWAGGMSVEGSSRDARLPEPLRQSVDVGLVAKREPRNVLDK